MNKLRERSQAYFATRQKQGIAFVFVTTFAGVVLLMWLLDSVAWRPW